MWLDLCFSAIGDGKDLTLSTLLEVNSAAYVYYTAAGIVRLAWRNAWPTSKTAIFFSIAKPITTRLGLLATARFVRKGAKQANRAYHEIGPRHRVRRSDFLRV